MSPKSVPMWPTATATSHQLGHQIVPMEEVVSQHQRGGVARQEVGTNQKCLGQTVRARLHGVLDRHSPAAAVAEQVLECIPVAWMRC